MEKGCEECRYFRVVSKREQEADVGQCRLEKRMGVFRGNMKACRAFSRHGEAHPSRSFSSSGGRSSAGTAYVDPRPDPLAPELLSQLFQSLEPEELKELLLESHQALLSFEQGGLGRDWSGGSLHLSPADPELKRKVLPLDQFFQKLLSIRDNLRVLEQKLNTLDRLSHGERLDLQALLNQSQRTLLHFARGWLPEPQGEGERGRVQRLLQRLLREAEGRTLSLKPPSLGGRWLGGHVDYIQGEERLEEPIEAFFFRLIQLRDRLHHLDAQLSLRLKAGEKELEQMRGYIRRSYGSLTTFNILFRERSDHFKSRG